jgi:gas vesicle protein GvpL/GvpF
VQVRVLTHASTKLPVDDKIAVRHIYRESGTDAHEVLIVDRRLLKNEVGEIVLNAAYLVDKSKIRAFDAKVKELKERFEKEGMTLHRSGPWAPYSFC